MPLVAQAQHRPMSTEEALAVPENPGIGWQNLELKDSEGKSFRFSEASGRMLVIDFFFTHCPLECPPQTASLKKVVDSLSAKTRKNALFVSVSVDPANDTTQKIKAYRDRFSIDSKAPWKFVNASEETTRALVGYFGGADEKNLQRHRNQLYVIGPDGTSLFNIPTVPQLDVERVKADLASSIEVFIKEPKQLGQRTNSKAL